MRKWIAMLLGVGVIVQLCGCSGIEPEKRRYPLAMGVDWSEGEFQVFYAMPDLPSSTGQQKQEEGGDTSVLSFADPSLCEIQRLYDKSQDKYLDVGHLEVLVLGPGLLEGRRWESFLEFMKSDPLVGEDMYVFEGENVDNLMNLNQSLGTSLGQYLTGIYENRLEGRERKGVTLKEVYYFWYEENRLPELPTLMEENGKIQVNFV